MPLGHISFTIWFTTPQGPQEHSKRLITTNKRGMAQPIIILQQVMKFKQYCCLRSKHGEGLSQCIDSLQQPSRSTQDRCPRIGLHHPTVTILLKYGSCTQIHDVHFLCMGTNHSFLHFIIVSSSLWLSDDICTYTTNELRNISSLKYCMLSFINMYRDYLI